MSNVTDVLGVEQMLEAAVQPVEAPSLAHFVARMPAERAKRPAQPLARQPLLLRPALVSRVPRRVQGHAAGSGCRSASTRTSSRLMSVWRVFHVVLAVVLVVMIAAHIGVSLYLGYRWIFK